MEPTKPSRTSINLQRIFQLFAMPQVSLRTLLISLVFALLIPLMGIAFYLQDQLGKNQNKAIRDGLMSSARTLASLVDNEIDTHLAVASTLAALDSLDLNDSVRFQSQVKRALEPLLGSWISVFDPSGKLLQSTLVDMSKPLPLRGAREVMEHAHATGLYQLSNVVFGPITRRYAAFLEYPVFRDGRPAYSIVLGLNPQRFKMLINDKFGDHTVAGILDRNHNFIARSMDHEKRVGTTAAASWREAIARSPEGVMETQLLEGTPVLTAYSRTRDGWTVGLGKPLSMVKDPVTMARERMLLLGLLLLVLGLLAAAAIGLSINRAMVRLAADAKALGQGAVIPAIDQPIKEVMQISAALSGASKDLATADEQQRNLLSEVNHRSKNFLGLVQAMARQTATHSPDQFLERFNERLRALASCQDVLVSRAWKNIALGPLLRSQLVHMEDGRENVIKQIGPEILVTAGAAEALGMAAYELATNATKYGALSVPDGRVTIAWGIEQQTFSIEWSESGGPPVSRPARKGFGWIVICQLTKAKLDADVTLDYAPAGVVWRLRCPVGHVLERP